MSKVTYEAAVMDAIFKAAASAREAGKTWKEAFACAKKAGYKGSESTLQKLVRAHMAAAKPVAQEAPPAGYKNTAPASKAVVAGTNDFSTTKSETTPKAAAPSSNPETLESIQNRMPVLRDGTHYARPISLFHGSFQNSNAGEIVAWSRILGKEEAVCVTNSHDHFPRGADVLVDNTLNPPGSFLTVIHLASKTSSASDAPYSVGTQLPVQRREDGTAFVSIRDMGPSEMLVLTNAPSILNSMA